MPKVNLCFYCPRPIRSAQDWVEVPLGGRKKLIAHAECHEEALRKIERKVNCELDPITMCRCGHPIRQHDRVLDYSCVAPGCECTEYRKARPASRASWR